MPVYNAAPYIHEAIESILGQTFSDLELVCQDDGSTDGSDEILASYALKDSRVRILTGYKGNRGVIAARNSLLAASTGELVAWMDADDVSELGRFKTQVEFLDDNPDYAAVGTAIILADERLFPGSTQTFDPSPERQATDPEICCATIMARSEAVKAAGPMREIFRQGGEDGDWVLRLSDHGRVTNLDAPLYLYRQHLASTSRYFAPIRRLGVLSRMAARVRRTTGADPLDDIAYDPELPYLRDDAILKDQNLTPIEKCLALTLPLRGEPPFASILIYFRDDHPYLMECLGSIRRQGFLNFEIVILDDASEESLDGDALRASGFASAVHIIRNDVAVGFDLGMVQLAAAARGIWLVSQRAGDFMREDRLVRQLEWMLANPNVIAAGALCNRVDLRSNVYHSDFFPEEVVDIDSFQGRPETVAVWKRPVSSPSARPGRARVRKAEPSVSGETRPGLLALPTGPSLVANVGDILYYWRVDNQVAEPAAKTHPDAVAAGRPQPPYHDLYYRIRTELSRAGLSVLSDHGASDSPTLRAEIWRLEPFIRAVGDRGLLGEALCLVAYAEWRRRERTLSELLKAWLHAPKSASRFARGLLQRHFDKQWMSLRNTARSLSTRRSREALRRPEVEAPEIRTRVAVYDAWGDLPDALDHLLPRQSRAWAGVEFVPAAELGPMDATPDYALILNHVGAQTVRLDMPPNRIWFAIGEPPTPVHRDLHLASGEQSRVLTPDQDSVEADQRGGRFYEHTLCMTRTWSVRRPIDQLADMKRPTKSKALSWVTSNLALLPGHRYRLQFLHRIEHELPLSLFGRGFNPIADKWDALAPFKYSIAFENTVAPGYSTEKIFDCFVAGAFPLYYGAPDLERYFPPQAFWRFDPEDVHVVEKMREIIESELWRERASFLDEAKDLVLNKYNMFKFIAEKMRADESDPTPAKAQWFYPVHVDFG